MCDWCGLDGWCCRKDWVENGCDGTIGGPGNHQCTLNSKSTGMFFKSSKLQDWGDSWN